VEEQIGTGPIAPPPGTPGVEPYGGGSTPMNTPEPGPNAPASAFSATPSPPPDSPAGWMGPGGGMIPQGAEFKPNRAGSPMIPGSLSERLKIVSRLAAAGPMYAKVAEKVLTQGLEAPEKAEQARLARADKAEQNALNRASKEEEAAYRRNQQEYIQSVNHSQQVLMAAINSGNKADLAMALAAMRHIGGTGAQGTFIDAGTSKSGNPLLRNSKGTNYVEIVNGEAVPYKGPILNKAENKAVEKAMDSRTQLEYTEDLAKRVADPANAAAFSKGAAIGSVLAGKTEGFVDPQTFKKLTDEQAGLRGEVGRNFAELMHKLYGSAYTANEKGTAASFAVLPGMDAKEVARRLRQQADFHRKMEEKYGDKIRGAATERTGGDARPPLSGM